MASKGPRPNLAAWMGDSFRNPNSDPRLLPLVHARHGSRQADGNEFGTEVSSVRLVVKEMKRPGRSTVQRKHLMQNAEGPYQKGTEQHQDRWLNSGIQLSTGC